MAEQQDTIPARENVLKLILLAICDPGSFLPREREERDGETLHESIQRWGARAVLAAIDEDPVLEIRPYYPTQDAYDAACKALERHRARAEAAETAIRQTREYAEHIAGSYNFTYAKAGRTVLDLLTVHDDTSADESSHPEDGDSINTLGLTVRTQNCLRRDGIRTVGELAQRTAAELLDIRNFGDGCLSDVVAKLHAHGRELRSSTDGGEQS